MIPIRDENPTRITPYVTYTLIALNVLVFLWESSLPSLRLRRYFYDHALVPLYFTANPYSIESFLDIMRSMFLHSGWLHLGSNMLYLWVFGDNIEDRFGRIGFLAAYFISGFAAAFLQTITNPNAFVPMVGASGAIAGILGAYIILFPNSRIICLIFFGFVFFVPVRAVFVLGIWFITQLLSGVASLGVETTAGGGVAFFAHIGGFMMGLTLGVIYRGLYGTPASYYPPRPVPQQIFGNPRPRLIEIDPRRQELIYLLAQKSREQKPASILTANGVLIGFIVGVMPDRVILRDSQGWTVTLPLDSILKVE